MTAYDIRTNVDFHKNQLLNAVLQVLSDDPDSPVQGQFYFVLSDRTVRFFDGVSVVSLGKLDQVDALQLEADSTALEVSRHESMTTDVHGIPNTLTLLTQTQLDSLAAAVFGATPYNPNETVAAGERRVYSGSVWEAIEDVLPGLPPLGIGDGSIADQELLINNSSGFARWVTGGLGKTVFVVANANDSGLGSLRAALVASQNAGGGWIIFDPSFNGGVYKIVLASDLMISGLNAANITVDGRGCDITIDGGGAPGLQTSPPAAADPRYPGAPAGIVGHSVIIGGLVYSDFNAGGNVVPAQNIIFHYVKFISNFGGEQSEPQDLTNHRVVYMNFWTRGIIFDHCSFTNPNQDTNPASPYFGRRYSGGTDGLVEGGYGATEVTLSWCHVYEHWKAIIIIDTIPPVPAQAPSRLAPGVDIDNPGPYELAVSPNTEGGASSPQTGDVINLVKWSIHHTHFEHISDRQPYVKGYATRVHLWDNHHDKWGSYSPDLNVTNYLWPDFETDGQLANEGAAVRLGHLAQVVCENDIFTPYVNSVLRGGMLALHTSDPAAGNLRTSGLLLEPYLSGAASRDADRGTSFNPATYYPYMLETADSALKARIDAGSGAKTGWKYIGPGIVKAAFDVLKNNVEVGSGGTPIAASRLNFAGSAFDAVTYDGDKTVTVHADAGVVDPTVMLLVGIALPVAGFSYLGKRFRVVSSLDAPINGTEYECRHNTTLNAYEWQQVGAAVLPVVISGQELGQTTFWPVAQMTNAALPAGTTVPRDISADAIVSAWPTVVATSFDVTFIVPPSRVVNVEVELALQAGLSIKTYIALASVTAGPVVTTIPNSQSMMLNNSSIYRLIYRKRLDSTVLPAAGSSFTIRPQWCTLATGTPIIYCGGTNGPLRVRVLAGM